MKNKRRGMTLVELIIVLIIVGVLMLAIFIGGNTFITKSRMSRTKSDLRSFETAARTMLLEKNDFITTALPTTASDWNKLVTIFNSYLTAELKLKTATTGADIYSNKTDAWGKPYQIVLSPDTANKNYFRIYIYSYGANSKTNTAGSKIDTDDLLAGIELGGGDVRTTYFGFEGEQTDGKDISTLVP